MATILEEIVEQTKLDLQQRKRKASLRDFESFELYEKKRQSFREALQGGDTVSIIAEIKKASPSKGIIRRDFDPVVHARQYREGGASALSVLTDQPAFQGSLEYLQKVAGSVELPLLRKDFIIDPYQVKEARAYGADAVLIIVKITGGNQLEELLHSAHEFGLDCLVECYDEEDLERLDFEEVSMLGVNNRDLRNFEVDVHRGIELLQRAPADTVLISESGLSSAEDLFLLQKEGIDAALIGEYFMRRDKPGEAVREMLEELENLSAQTE